MAAWLAWALALAVGVLVLALAAVALLARRDGWVGLDAAAVARRIVAGLQGVMPPLTAARSHVSGHQVSFGLQMQCYKTVAPEVPGSVSGKTETASPGLPAEGESADMGRHVLDGAKRLTRKGHPGVAVKAAAATQGPV